jgi:hypothetical protein
VNVAQGFQRVKMSQGSDARGHVDNLARQRICAATLQNVSGITFETVTDETVYVTAITL